MLGRTERIDMKKKTSAFRANTVPETLKLIEVLGILQAREWQVASLDELRGFSI